MTSSPLNPAQHVERIREILIGRDLQHMHGRISRIEGAMEKELPADGSSPLQETITQLQNEHSALRQELETLKNQKEAPQSQSSHVAPGPELSSQLASQMAARIDARFREILSHLQNELLQLKGQFDSDLRSLKSSKADRSELSSRFARLASAAMLEQDQVEKKKTEGFLL
jgi:predicted  nucleic acid-binding Zn-ribbon protein